MVWTNVRGTEWKKRLVNNLHLTTQLQPLANVNKRCIAVDQIVNSLPPVSKFRARKVMDPQVVECQRI